MPCPHVHLYAVLSEGQTGEVIKPSKTMLLRKSAVIEQKDISTLQLKRFRLNIVVTNNIKQCLIKLWHLH